ncbi:MAG: molybdopterin converting factor subunit 1 [Myxococcota bacterium]|nr:molybdopterin converting factor subunit 1 [Myxococcota bacterium]
MRVKLLLFAIYRERLGSDELLMDISGETINLGQLRAQLVAEYPDLAGVLSVTRFAVNQAFAADDTILSEADEIALIPPVSGGKPSKLFSVRDQPITLEMAESQVRGDGAGAIVTFTGTVRNKTKEHEVSALEYEAYVPMAEAYLQKIGSEVIERWPGAACSIIHRSGRVEVGQVSVVIAVSHPHRAEAFDGCRYAIENLKKDVPIWKKEFRADGSVWVGVGS